MTFPTAEDLRQIPGFLQGLTDIRRNIHAHPETAFEENRTSDLVAAELEKMGLQVHRGYAKTAVIGTLKGARGGGKTIGLRADMDALHIMEENSFDHRSTINGKMHACGHDGHTTMLLGAAKILSENPDFAGTVQFIFQPAEEGEGGANVMIREGFLDEFPLDEAYAMHNAPGVPVGQFAIRKGPMLAAGDTWEVNFKGTGAHGAVPEEGTDVTMAVGTFVSALSSIVARNVSAADAAVISIGYMACGDYNAPNIIPANAVIRGTARSFLHETRDLIERRLEEVAKAAATAHACDAELLYTRRYPPLVNAKTETDLAVKAAVRVVGEENVEPEVDPIGGSEDFAFFLKEVPGAYMLLGNGVEGTFVHTPTYDFNDEALVYGVSWWLQMVDVSLNGDA